MSHFISLQNYLSNSLLNYLFPCHYIPPRMILWEYQIELVTVKHRVWDCVSTRVFFRGVSCFGTGCPCSAVRRWTTCPLYVQFWQVYPKVIIMSCRLPFIFITIYGVVCVQLAHFSIGDWKDISVAHVIIIIKSELSTYSIVIIFFRGCVPEMFVTSYSVTYCIYAPGKPGICLHYYCAVYDVCK